VPSHVHAPTPVEPKRSLKSLPWDWSVSGRVNQALAGIVKILPRGVLRALAARRSLRKK